MFHKILTAVLAAVVLVEGAYILLRRHPANRSCFRVITTTLMKVTAVWWPSTRGPVSFAGTYPLPGLNE